MFGKGLIKIIGLIIAGAIALAAGAELLASVVSVVLSFRGGNPLPLVSVIIIDVVLLRLIQRQPEETPVKMVLNIAAYATTGYIAVVAFVIALPYGLVASVAAAVVAVVVCSLFGDPSSIVQQIHTAIPGMTLGARLDGLSKRMIPVGNGNSFALNVVHNLILVNQSEKERIIHLMNDRPLLPISLTHFEDTDVLFITTEDQSLVESVRSLLDSAGIKTDRHPSPLLAEVLQMVPIIDEYNGFSMHNYRVARNDKAVSDLLVSWPLRTTVFPSDSGVMILVPDSVSTGLNVEKIQPGCESEIILNRNFAALREVAKQVETAT